MGCTSSASSIVASNATDIKLKCTEESNEIPIEEINNVIKLEALNDVSGIKVLPTCDNLDEQNLLAQSDETLEEKAHVDTNKDTKSDNFKRDNECTDIPNDSFKPLEDDEKLSKLEEVVDRVVELYSVEISTHNTPEKENTNMIECNEVVVPDKPELTELEQKCEHLEGAISPSQSESSRATRWEALADIAAELPPSLAVDPLTGQIYTLAK